jgi:hypothetical protein
MTAVIEVETSGKQYRRGMLLIPVARLSKLLQMSDHVSASSAEAGVSSPSDASNIENG